MRAPSCTCNAPESWLAIPDWEGLYEASSHGRIRSIDRVVTTASGARRYRGRVLRPALWANGYHGVALYRVGVQFSREVHALVLRTFAGPPPVKGMESRHGDGDSAHNCSGNLIWGTHSDNNYDQVRHGTHHEASKTNCSLDHLLVVPNLVQARLPYRICLACARARSNCHYAHRLGRALNLQDTADMHYRRIMTNYLVTTRLEVS